MIGKSTILAAGTALALALPAGAVTVTITTDGSSGNVSLNPTVLFGTGGVVSTAEPGGPPIHTMAGTSVTASFTDGTTASGIWADFSTAANPTGCGHVNNSMFRLWGCDDTFDSVWRLVNKTTNAAMDFLEIDLRGTPLWFDRTEPSPGTPGSNAGRDFMIENAGNNTGDVTATYSIAGFSDPSDTWKILSVDFTGLDGGGMTGNITFRQDVDAIPLPAALPLLITALGLLGLFRRRRQAA